MDKVGKVSKVWSIELESLESSLLFFQMESWQEKINKHKASVSNDFLNCSTPVKVNNSMFQMNNSYQLKHPNYNWKDYKVNFTTHLWYFKDGFAVRFFIFIIHQKFDILR